MVGGLAVLLAMLLVGFSGLERSSTSDQLVGPLSLVGALGDLQRQSSRQET